MARTAIHKDALKKEKDLEEKFLGSEKGADLTFFTSSGVPVFCLKSFSRHSSRLIGPKPQLLHSKEI